MQYLFFIATDTEPETDQGAVPSIDAWVDEGSRRGVWLQGDRIRPPAEATTVRVRGGEVRRTAGPLTESAEQIVGYDLVECADLDEAVDYASRHPMAHLGRIEIRAIWPIDGP